MAFDKIVGVDGTTYQFPTLVRARIADNIEAVGSDENLAVIAALGPALATKSATTHNHTLASLSSNGIDELGDVEIGVVGGNGIALADKHTLQYESSTSKWRNKVASGGVTVSDTPPATPIPGDAWFDSNDGTLYVYYTDVNTTQWVQVQANSALEGTILSRLGAVEARATALEAVPDYSPNYVINGGFDIWQRGTSYTGVGYSADRWFASISTISVSRSTDAPSGFTYSANVTRSTGTSNYVSQRIESANSRELVGKTVNISFWAKNAGVDETLEVSIYTADSVDNFSAMTIYGAPVIVASSAFSTSWTRYSATFNNLPSSAANGVHMQIVARTEASVPGHSLYLTGVQLESGSVATSFRRNANSLQGELAACQRYYCRMNKVGIASAVFGNAIAQSTTNAYATIQYPVEMRVAPTSIDTAAITGSNYQLAVTGLWNTNITAMSLVNPTELEFQIYITTTGLTQGNTYHFRSGTTSGYLGFSAEL